MRDECQQSMADALGRALKPSEAKEAEDAVSLHMRLAARSDPQAWAQMSQQQRLEAGAKAAAQDLIDGLKMKQRRVALQIAAHDRIENSINQALDRLGPNKEHWWQFGRTKPGSMLRATSELLAFDPAGHGITSVETSQKAIFNEAMGNLSKLWNSVGGFAHLYENREGVRDLVRELHGENTGNVAAREGAKAWVKITDGLRARANDAGMDIGKLEDWHYPQNWSQSRVATAAGNDPSKSLEKFIGDMLPLLDRDKYLNVDGSRMKDSDLQKMLGGVFDTITTDGQNKAADEFKRRTQAGAASASYTPSGLGGRVADRLSAHRALYFKDADSYMTAQGLYGNGTLWPALKGHIGSISRDIALVETLGPNAAASFKFFNDRALLDEKRQYPGSAPSINSAHKLNESLFDFVAGQRAVVNDKIEAMGATFRNFETATKLGSVALTALGDEAGMAATAFANKIPWSEVAMRQMKLMGSSDARAAAAEHAGLGLNRMIGGLNRFGQEDLRFSGGEGSAAGAMRALTGKLASGVLNASGAEFMWDLRRQALGQVLMSYLGKWTRQAANFKDLSFDDVGMLSRKGVTEQDWQVWKHADLEDMGLKHGVLTPKSVMAIPDEKLAGIGDPTALRRHAATMLLGHVLEETGMGVMDTGARERASMLFGTQAGTKSGELIRSAFLFKSFAMSMMMKHWARAASMPTGGSTAKYAATLVVTGTIMGALANQLRNLTQGKDPENMASPKFWGTAILRGGGLGFYGDFLYDELNSNDNSLIPAVLGPLATTGEDFFNLTAGALFKDAKGERTDWKAKLVRFGKGNIPFQNMWYTKAAFDHLIWNDMQEAASPGYLDRMQAKAYTQKGTSYWWDPHDAMPSQGPDLSKAIQPDRGRDEMRAIAQATGAE